MKEKEKNSSDEIKKDDGVVQYRRQVSLTTSESRRNIGGYCCRSVTVTSLLIYYNHFRICDLFLGTKNIHGEYKTWKLLYRRYLDGFKGYYNDTGKK